METLQSFKPPKPPKQNFLRKFFANNFIDLRGLPLTLKLLTTAGYLAVLGQLLFILFIERFGTSHLPVVTYALGEQGEQVPLIIVAVTALAFIMGWVFLLTGAATSKARVFLPILLIFALQLFMVSSLLGFVVELLFIFVVLAIYAFTFRTNFWRDLPGLHFFGWLIAISAIFILSVGTSATNADLASALATNFGFVMVLTMAFWVLLGFSVFSLGIQVARFITRFARKYLPVPVITSLAIFLLIVHPMVAFLVVYVGKDTYWAIDLPLALLFPLAALVVWIMRRWSATTAAVFLALSIATPIVMFGLSGSFAGRSFTENILKMTGLFTPILLFVVMTTYNLLGMGVTFTRVGGKIMPRPARILLYFGTLILVVACMLFITNERLTTTGELATDFQGLITNVVSLSAFFLLIPYAVWMIWKKRELLIGPKEDSALPPRWSRLAKVPRAAWIVLSLVLSCSCVCILWGVLTWLVSKG